MSIVFDQERKQKNMEDIKMIVSEETLRENQKKELLKDSYKNEQKKKALRKVQFLNGLGVLAFYSLIIAMCLFIHYFGN